METLQARTKPAHRWSDLPWIDEIKAMSDALPPGKKKPQAEDWPMRKLGAAGNDLVLLCLAYRHRWELSHDSHVRSYVATLTDEGRHAAIWSHPPQNPGQEAARLRGLLRTTQNGEQRRLLLRFDPHDPHQSAKALACALDRRIRQMLACDELPDGMASAWCFRHEILQ